MIRRLPRIRTVESSNLIQGIEGEGLRGSPPAVLGMVRRHLGNAQGRELRTGSLDVRHDRTQIGGGPSGLGSGTRQIS